MGLFNRSPRNARKTKRQSQQQQHAAGFEPLENRQLLSVSVAEPAGSASLVNTHTASHQETDWYGQSVDVDADGDSVVVWSSYGQDGSGWGIFGQRYDRNGNKAGGEFQINSSNSLDQYSPSVAMSDNGDFVVTWMSLHVSGNYWDVYAQRYAADGTARGGEVRVNTTTIDQQMYSEVAADAEGNFVVSWGGYVQDATGLRWGVATQRYAADGTARGGEVLVTNEVGSINMWDGGLSMDDAGNYVVAWSEHTADNAQHVFARQYSADGTPRGNKFQVDHDGNNTNGSWTGRSYVDVAVDDSGDFVVAWSRHHNGTQGSNYTDVYARRYASNGAAGGSQFLVNTTVSSEQVRPSVDADAAGNFVIAWQGIGTDNHYGIQFQQYAADGSAVGVETLVDPGQVNSNGYHASVGVADNGDFTVAWSRYHYNGSYTGDFYDVYARRYTVGHDTAPVLDSVSTNAGLIGSVSENGQVNLTALFTDPDADDTHTASISWGDGSTTGGTVDEGAGLVSATHAYAAGGVYNVVLTLTDPGAGATVTRSALVFVTGSGVHNGVLQVIGTAGPDRIDVIPKDGKIRAGSNFTGYRFYNTADVSRFYLATGGGDDKMNVWETVLAQGVMDGGAGNDELWAGLRTLLIGGTGADKINGANGDDILVASSTTLDSDLPALFAVLSGARRFVAAEMINDGASDTLWGHRGTDEYWGNFSGDGVIDVLNMTYMRPDEQVFDIA